MLLYRKYKVIKKVKESNLIVSLYLKSVDNEPLIKFRPGQHLMLRLYIPGCEMPAFRYYSFSDNYHPDYYRISIKKEVSPFNNPGQREGLSSSYIYHKVKEGDILEAKGPSGNFFLNPEEKKPIVLIAGGIGITPLLCMLKTVAVVNPQREVYLFYGINEKCGYAFQAELLKVRNLCPDFKFFIFCSKVEAGDLQGQDFDYSGFIKSDIILKQTKKSNADYYICGPGGLVKYITDEFEKVGIAKDKIHIEAFSSDVQDLVSEQESSELLLKKYSKKGTGGFTIEFTRAKRKILWDKRYKSILELAEANDIDISSGCLFGDCGTCLTPIQLGQIKYTHNTMVKPESGKCLVCSCVPLSNLILEA